MRLSEAVRLGSMLGPQLIGELVNGKGGSCVLGAALLATLGYERWSAAPYWDLMISRYPQLLHQVQHPKLGHTHQTLQSIAVELNNNYHWTREQIAAWIAQTVETPQPKEGGDDNEQRDTSSAAAADRDQEPATVAA